jgi:hypothetical protein
VRSKPKIPAEEYAAYDAVISSMFAGGLGSFNFQARVKLLVIENRTVTNFSTAAAGIDEWELVKQRFPTDIRADLLADLSGANLETR